MLEPLYLLYTKNYSELLMVENTFPILGPRMVKAAITTIATKTRINAYSTRPWPFSLGANNMEYFSFLLKFFCMLQTYPYFTLYATISKSSNPFLLSFMLVLQD